MQTEGIEHYAVYPPVVESVEKLGYVMDSNKRAYSRDIGRSAVIGGRCYYIFGDTFCKNEQGLFCGLQSNSVAKAAKGAPLINHYLGIKPEGLVDPLIPLDDEEKQLQNTVLPLQEKYRVCLWCFGGIVETSPGVGWLWYEKSVRKGEAEVQYCKYFSGLF